MNKDKVSPLLDDDKATAGNSVQTDLPRAGGGGPYPVDEAEGPVGTHAIEVGAAVGTVALFERLARDKDVDVEKLQRLIDMQKEILAHQARAAFNVAFAAMQAALPEIDEKGAIKDRSGTVRSKYAKLEDIQKAIKPVLQAHGFSLRHRTEWPDDRKGIIRIVGILAHTEGHSEESVFEAPADASDFRTDIQSMGSTVSYGRRYTTIDLLNITTRGQDTDGQKREADKPAQPEPVDGLTFEAWWKGVTEAAGRGVAAFDPAWECSPPPFKNYVARHDQEGLRGLKAAARAAGKGKP